VIFRAVHVVGVAGRGRADWHDRAGDRLVAGTGRGAASCGRDCHAAGQLRGNPRAGWVLVREFVPSRVATRRAGIVGRAARRDSCGELVTVRGGGAADVT
jgi:hypothetical protein